LAILQFGQLDRHRVANHQIVDGKPRVLLPDGYCRNPRDRNVGCREREGFDAVINRIELRRKNFARRPEKEDAGAVKIVEVPCVKRNAVYGGFEFDRNGQIET
jgi:hypothetical protein